MPNDAQRVARALELLDAGADPPGGAQLWTGETRLPTLLVALTMDRAALYARIDARVEAMVAAGAEDEVRRADAAGASPSARQALGFDGAAARRRRRDAAAHAPLRQAPAHLAAQAARARSTIDVTGRDAQSVAGEVRSALRVAAESSSEPMKRENGPMNAQ